MPWLVCLAWAVARRSAFAYSISHRVALLNVIFWVWLKWAWRDGFIPDDVESERFEALRRFLFGLPWVALPCLVPFGITALAKRLRAPRTDDTRE